MIFAYLPGLGLDAVPRNKGGEGVRDKGKREVLFFVSIMTAPGFF